MLPELQLQEKTAYWPYSSIALLPVVGDEVGSSKVEATVGGGRTELRQGLNLQCATRLP